MVVVSGLTHLLPSVTEQLIQNQLLDSIVGNFKRNQKDKCSSIKRVDRVWLCSVSRTNSDLCLVIARSDGRQGKRGIGENRKRSDDR